MFFHAYPYSDAHELNLDWLLAKVKELNNKLTDFVTLNTIKYADPIEWDITSQYETNTVVIDQSTGIAYLSSRPVPAGVSISNTAYWSVIFDLQQIIGNISANLTIHDNGSSPTLLGSVNEGDWILWNNKLYVALAPLVAGTALIVDSNISAATVEQLTKDYTDALASLVGSLADLNTSDKTSIVNAINSLLSDIQTLVGSLSDLTTSDTSSIVNAINSLKLALDQEIIDRGDADNTLDGRITALENKNVIYYNVKNYGAVGDGVTDDTAAVKDAVTACNLTGGVVYFPAGSYVLTDPLIFTRYGCTVMGENSQATYLFIQHDGSGLVFGDGVTPKQAMTVMHIGIVNQGSPSDSQYGVFFRSVVNSVAFDVVISGFKRGFGMMHAGNTSLYSVGITSDVSGASGFYIYDHSVSSCLDNCYVGFSGSAVDDGLGAVLTNGNIADITFKYFDIGNGAIGIYLDGSSSPADFPPADIRLYDIVADGQRTACISINNINGQGNVLIQGGWLNPQTGRTPAASCIALNNVNNINVDSVVLQQLLNDTPSVNGITGNTVVNLSVNNCNLIQLDNAFSLGSADVVRISDNNASRYAGTTAGTFFGGSGIYELTMNDNYVASGHVNAVAIDSGDQAIITNNQFKGGAISISAVTNQIYKDNLIAGTPQV